MRANDFEPWSGGYPVYLRNAFFYIFMMQGVFSLVVNAAALHVMLNSNSATVATTDVIGATVWAFGFVFEWVGDEQLKRHLATTNRSPAKRFLTNGLWRYTRHPNYFGEACLWWGIYIIGVSVPAGWKRFFAPIFMTLLLRFVSGVPLLEKKFAGNPEWEAYCRETNVFVPMPPAASAKKAA